MPMFKALKACPEAVVIKPRHSTTTSRRRAGSASMMQRAHAAGASRCRSTRPISTSPAPSACTTRRRPSCWRSCRSGSRRRSGSPSRSASPSTSSWPRWRPTSTSRAASRVIGRDEAPAFLAPRPVRVIAGVGRAQSRRRWRRTASAPSATFAPRDLKALCAAMATRRCGCTTRPRPRRPRGRSRRRAQERSRRDHLQRGPLRPEALEDTSGASASRSPPAQHASVAGRVVTLKLQAHRFQDRHPPPDPAAPTQMADRIYRAALPMLRRDIGLAPFRLIGVGLSALVRGTIGPQRRPPGRRGAQAAGRGARRGRDSRQIRP